MSNRIKVFLFIGLAIIAIMALSSGLTGLELGPGKPFPLPQINTQQPQDYTAPLGEAAFNVIKIIYFVLWLFFPIILIYLIISPSARKRLLRDLLRILPFVLLFIFGSQFIQNLAARLQLSANLITGGGLVNPGMMYPSPEDQFIPSAPNWAVWIVSLGLSILVVVVIVMVTWMIWRRRKKQEPYQRLADEAQSALDSLEEGQDLKNVVVRCYYEMSKVISEARGIKRFSDMTPHEFQEKLEAKGLPSEPVQQLTSLFEEVRYGQRATGKNDEQRAVSSLTAIMEYCRGGL